MRPEQLPVYLGRIADALAGRGAAAAANAMAAEFDRALVDVTLKKTTHKRGEKTPSAPGQPPALVSGTLRRSVKIIPAVPAGPRASAEVTVTAVYARIQELGGTVTARRAPYLKWKDAGGWHQVKSVKLPKRPYMKPTRDALVASGALKRVAVEALKAVIRAAR